MNQPAELATAQEINLDEKEQALHARLLSLESVIVAYSGGVDSAYLAYAAHRRAWPADAGDYRRLGQPGALAI